MKIDEQMISEMGSIMKLEFSQDETKELVTEINKTLEMLATLQEVDTENIEGTFYGVVNKEASFRKDEPIQDQEEVKALLENAIDSEENQIKVPAILDDGEGGA